MNCGIRMQIQLETQLRGCNLDVGCIHLNPFYSVVCLLSRANHELGIQSGSQRWNSNSNHLTG